jgi:hypothetical protein
VNPDQTRAAQISPGQSGAIRGTAWQSVWLGVIGTSRGQYETVSTERVEGSQRQSGIVRDRMKEANLEQSGTVRDNLGQFKLGQSGAIRGNQGSPIWGSLEQYKTVPVQQGKSGAVRDRKYQR